MSYFDTLSEMERGKPAPITHYKCHELLLNKVVTIVITQKAYQTDCQSHNKCGKSFFKATLATFGPFGYLSKCMANLATFKSKMLRIEIKVAILATCCSVKYSACKIDCLFCFYQSVSSSLSPSLIKNHSKKTKWF